jgi:hypothetical protein
MKKLCVNCKYFVNKRCTYKPDLVHGKSVAGWRGDPRLLREETWLGAILFGTCGRRGRWWKQREESE